MTCCILEDGGLACSRDGGNVGRREVMRTQGPLLSARLAGKAAVAVESCDSSMNNLARHEAKSIERAQHDI